MAHFASPPAIIPAFIRPHPPFEQPPLEHLLPVAFPPPTQHVPSSSRGHISPIIIQIALLSLILSPLELPASVESLLDSLVRLHHHHHHLALSADSSLWPFLRLPAPKVATVFHSCGVPCFLCLASEQTMALLLRDFYSSCFG